MTTTTSYSGLTLHRRCPMAWSYRYIEHLDAAAPQHGPLREIGTWWHALRAAEAIERGRARGSLRYVPATLRLGHDAGEIEVLNDLAPSNVQEAAEGWWRRQERGVQEENIAQLGAPLPEALAGIWDRWERAWREERKCEEPLAVEVRAERELPVLGDDADGATKLVGVIDEVYRDSRRDLIVVRDAKTHRKLSTQTAAEDLLDSQLQLYGWLITPLVKSWGGAGVRALSYDRVRSQAPATPQVTKAGKLSKSVTDYDLVTYLDWARDGVEYSGTKKDGSGAGTYRVEHEVIEKLSSPAARSAWTQRTLTPLNANVVRAHLQAAVDSADDVARTRKRYARTGEAARNMTRTCSWCEYASLCRAQLIGGPQGEYDPAEHGLVSTR